MPALLLSLFLCILPCRAFAAEFGPETQLDWELRRDRNAVQVYTADVVGSPIDAVRSTTIVNGVRLSSMVALIMDAQACPLWAKYCESAFLHEQISASEFHVYINNDLPFPLRDRDVLARVTWSQDADSGAVIMQSRPVPGIYPEQRGRLRLNDANVYWIFRPIGNGDVEVINIAHIDPGTILPAWITNMFIVDIPFDIVTSFANNVGQEKYAAAEFSFVTEP